VNLTRNTLRTRHIRVWLATRQERWKRWWISSMVSSLPWRVNSSTIAVELFTLQGICAFGCCKFINKICFELWADAPILPLSRLPLGDESATDWWVSSLQAMSVQRVHPDYAISVSDQGTIIARPNVYVRRVKNCPILGFNGWHDAEENCHTEYAHKA